METIEITMTDIEKRTRAFAADQRQLRFLLDAMQAEVDDARRRAMRAIRGAVERTKTSRAELAVALEQRPDLFTKPRTVVIDGIKVGWQKQKGTLQFDDAAKVCSLIYKHMPDMADVLIETTQRPLKSALAAMTASDLRRIGVSLTDDTDAVLIKDTVGDIDKLINALLADDPAS